MTTDIWPKVIEPRRTSREIAELAENNLISKETEMLWDALWTIFEDDKENLTRIIKNIVEKLVGAGADRETAQLEALEIVAKLNWKGYI